jgi:hypothetical protein
VYFVNLKRLFFSGFALQKIFADDMSCRAMQATIALGEIVEEASDTVFPTYLLLTPGHLLDIKSTELLHVRCAHDVDSSTGYVVNADALYSESGKEIL